MSPDAFAAAIGALFGDPDVGDEAFVVQGEPVRDSERLV